MADGAGLAAVAGGVVMILTAGIPILFLSGKDEKEDAATRAANMEAGLKSEMGQEAFDEAMMEVVEEAVVDEVVEDDGKEKKSASI